jgi:arylsulfatase A-like enzyme
VYKVNKPSAALGALLGLLGGVILFASELLATYAHTEIDIRTCLFFLALFITTGTLGGALLGMLLNFLRKKFSSAKIVAENANFFSAGFLASIYFLYGFYYINQILTPGTGVFQPISLAANLLFAIFALIVFWLASSYPAASKSSARTLVESAMLPLALLVAVNVRFFMWQSPNTQTREVFLGVLGFGLAGVFGIFISQMVAKLLSNRAAFSFIFNGVLTLFALYAFSLSGPPSAASFQIHPPARSTQVQLLNPKNVIWIVMDTARRDQISAYGGEPDRTPRIDAFAEGALVMNRAVSSAPWTIPSHASMFTGMFPSKHGADRNVPGGKFTNPLVSENLTIAEILQSYGYDTACMAANVAGLSRNFGFDQGFNYYFDARPIAYYLLFGQVLVSLPQKFKANVLRLNEIPLSSEVNGIVFDWLERRNPDVPFFLFINYMEPHDGVEYIPEPFYSMYDFKKSEYDRLLKNLDHTKVVHFQQEVAPAQRDMMVKLLARRLYFLDYHIGKLLDKLREMELFDDALIVITSDHGDLNGEHHSFGHNTDLYNELIWVPLIVRYPGAAKIGFSDQTVQNIDIMPEILNCLGIAIPQEVQGQPFEEVTHDIIAELFEQKKAQALLNPERYYRDLRAIYTSVNGDTLKYIWCSNGNDELFDMLTDQNELNNIVPLKPEVVKLLERRLDDWLKSFKPIGADEAGKMKFTKEVEDRLRSLGYLK